MMKRELFIKLPVRDACFIRAVLQEADLEKEHDVVQDAIRRLERLLPELVATEAASPGRGERVSQQNRRSPDRIV